MEFSIGEEYRIKTEWTFDNRRVIFYPVPANIIKIIDVIDKNIVFSYLFNDYKYLLSKTEFQEKLNPVLINS